MAQMPKATDLFGDVKPKKAAELQEQYQIGRAHV